jgi:iron transport multicopper oxidase
MTVSDWYHDQAPSLINFYQSKKNNNVNFGAEPIPNSAIINDILNPKFAIIPGKRYLFHIINMGAYASQYISL